MDIYRRAMAYFRRDWRWIALLVGLIGISVLVGLAEAWPAAVLIDSVLSSKPPEDRIHRALLSFLPDHKLRRFVGLVLIGLTLQLVGYSVWMARMMINYHLNYRGTTRVRAELFAALQRIGMACPRATGPSSRKEDRTCPAGSASASPSRGRSLWRRRS